MLTSAAIRMLPVPSDAQFETFTEHLISVHSWYKHLPLMDGGEFVVFLAPDAGENYPTRHPRLPTTILPGESNSAEGYRLAFGHLDYMWRANPGEPFDRDGHGFDNPPAIDNEILEFGRFFLHPYISREFYWSVHEDAVVRIRNGAQHPHARAILEAYDAEKLAEDAWGRLSREEREVVIAIDDRAAALLEKSLADPLASYIKLEVSARAAYARLREPEENHLRRSVNRLRAWLTA